jgi:hypothetical protein
MISMIIFVLVATASTFLLGAAFNTQQYAQSGATSDSQVQFAIQRITENIRAANVVSITANSITITSPPSPLISNSTFTINYFLVGNTLMESYVNNGNGTTYSSDVIVYNVTQFSVATLAANAKAFQITLTAGTEPSVSRTFVAFGRNL